MWSSVHCCATNVFITGSLNFFLLFFESIIFVGFGLLQILGVRSVPSPFIGLFDCKMAMRAVTAAWHSSNFSSFLFILCVFTFTYVFFTNRVTVANMQYSRTELLMVLEQNCTRLMKAAVTSFHQRSEEQRTLNKTSVLLKWRRRWRHRKQKRGKWGGLRAKLKANPHKPAIPCLFLANSWSLN